MSRYPFVITEAIDLIAGFVDLRDRQRRAVDITDG
jgi:hypothetical protein